MPHDDSTTEDAALMVWLWIAHEIALDEAYAPDDDPRIAAERLRHAEELAAWARDQLAALGAADDARDAAPNVSVLARPSPQTRPVLAARPRMGCLRARSR